MLVEVIVQKQKFNDSMSKTTYAYYMQSFSTAAGFIMPIYKATPCFPTHASPERSEISVAIPPFEYWTH